MNSIKQALKRQNQIRQTVFNPQQCYALRNFSQNFHANRKIPIDKVDQSKDESSETWTEYAKDTVNEYGEKIKKGAENLKDTMKDYANDFQQAGKNVKEGIKSEYIPDASGDETIQQQQGKKVVDNKDLGDKAKDYAEDVSQEAAYSGAVAGSKKVGRDVKESVKDASKNAYDSAKEAKDKVKETAKEYTNRAYDAASSNKDKQ